MLNSRTAILIAAVAVVMQAASMAMSSSASADPVSDLAAAVEARRAGSHCPPMQPDPLVVRTAEWATQESVDYITFRSAAVPFTDPMPALKTFGYTGSKAVLLAGYGPNEADAINGLMLQDAYDKVISDCSYSQFGVSARQEEGFIVTALVLAAS